MPLPTVPPSVTDLVKHFEGRYLTAYQDPGGVWTIGYGHTGPEVKKGLSIDGAKADSILASDLSHAAQEARSLVKVRLTSDQLGALTSFVFNLGAGALASSTLLRMVNQANWAAAKEQFGRWTYATINGKHVALPGLAARRTAEAAMFDGCDWRATVTPS